MLSLSFFLTFVAILSPTLVSAFSGNFELTNLVVSSPFQADPKSTEGSYVSCKPTLPLKILVSLLRIFCPGEYFGTKAMQSTFAIKTLQTLDLPTSVSNGPSA